MRFSLISIIVVAALGFVAGPASANRIKIGGVTTKQTLKDHCDQNGGSYSSNKGGYQCIGQGGAVVCSNKGKCEGTTFASREGGKNGIPGILGTGGAGTTRAGSNQGPPSTTGIKPIGMKPPPNVGSEKSASGGTKVIEQRSGGSNDHSGGANEQHSGGGGGKH